MNNTCRREKEEEEERKKVWKEVNGGLIEVDTLCLVFGCFLKRYLVTMLLDVKIIFVMIHCR